VRDTMRACVRQRSKLQPWQRMEDLARMGAWHRLQM
jgi:hypothetical protein